MILTARDLPHWSKIASVTLPKLCGKALNENQEIASVALVCLSLSLNRTALQQ